MRGTIALALMLGAAPLHSRAHPGWCQEPQDVSDRHTWAIVLLDQAERTLREERQPLRFAHGALVLAQMLRETEPERASRLVRAAAHALAQVDFETFAERLVRLKQRAGFRTPYDVDLLWERVLEHSAASDTEFLKEALEGLKADEVWKADALARLARSLEDDRKMGELITLSLTYGVTRSLVDLLFHLRGKNPPLADALFRSAVHRAVARKDLEGLYWLGAYAIPGVNLPNRFSPADPPPPDPRLARFYLNVLVEQLAHVAFSASRIPAHIYWALMNIHPQAERFAPELLGRIESLLTFVTSRLPASAIAYIERREEERRTRPETKAEDLITKARTARDDRTHDALMAHAAHLLSWRRDFAEALSIASKIRDRTVRQEMSDLIRCEAVAHFLQEGALEDAGTHALALENAERSVIAAARVLEKMKEAERRTGFLERVQSRFAQITAEDGKARAALYLAVALLPNDPAQGEMALIQAIDLFNKARLDLNGAIGAGITVEVQDFAAVCAVGSFDLAPVVIQVFERLARQEPDPSRLAAVALSWTSAEIRAIAQAALAVTTLHRERRDREEHRKESAKERLTTP